MDASPPAPPPARIRQAFVMAVNPGKADEFASRHNPIWPELASALKEHGAHNYSIFYYPTTRQLFAYVEVEDEARWNAVGRTAVCQRWWAHLSEIMPSNADHRPARAKLSEVFHLA